MKAYSIDLASVEAEDEDLRKIAASIILDKMRYAVQMNEGNLRFIEEYVDFEILDNPSCEE